MAIGVDSDQYLLVAPTPADVQRHHHLRRQERRRVGLQHDQLGGREQAVDRRAEVYDLKNGGVGYSTSGGFIDDITPKLLDAKAKIIAGTIKVPTTLS